MQAGSISRALYRPDHYHALDFLRGLAAVAVLVFHYQHFYYPLGSFRIDFRALSSSFPLYDLLFPLYLHGDIAVQIFWMISGFVFANVYAGKYTPAGEFLVRRLARLYPLHFLTLIIIAVLQLVAVDWFGTYLIYKHNDAYHFGLNLLIASRWGFERGLSFNGPIWSVSVEVLIYLLFWLVAKHLMRAGAAGPVLLAALAGFLSVQGFGSFRIWQCAQYFFIGCALYQIAGQHDRPVRDLAIIVGAAIAGFVIIIFGAGLSIDHGLLLLSIILVGGAGLIDLHPSGAVFRHLRFVGDSTYGIYLLHFPVQLVALLLLHRFGLAAEVRAQPAFLLLFVVTCGIVGWLSFVVFEKPANRMILRYWKGRGKEASSAPPSSQL